MESTNVISDKKIPTRTERHPEVLALQESMHVVSNAHEALEMLDILFANIILFALAVSFSFCVPGCRASTHGKDPVGK